MKKELENRLIVFASRVIYISEYLNKKPSSTHLYSQVMRSSTSTALNYGEAQNAESKKDFTHKINIVLKELRETYINLKIIETSKLSTNSEIISSLIKENDELLAIFSKTIQTIRKQNIAQS